MRTGPNPREEDDKIVHDTWVIGPVLRTVGVFEESVKAYPLIPMGTPDPYVPSK
jgi:arylsulfatase